MDIDGSKYITLRVEGAYVCLRQVGPGGAREKTFWTSVAIGPTASTPVTVHAAVANAGGAGRVAVVCPDYRCELPSVRQWVGESSEDAAVRAAAEAGWRVDARTLRQVIDRTAASAGLGLMRHVVFVAGCLPDADDSDVIRMSIDVTTAAGPTPDRSPLLVEATTTAAWVEAVGGGAIRAGAR